MGKFEITTPDGKKYEIEAADAQSANATLEEFMAQGQGNSPAPPAQAPQGLRPGTQEYADWAGQQARASVAAGQRPNLPQVSDPAIAQPPSGAVPDGEWNAPGSLVPIQFQQGTGAMRPAMPSLITDALSAFQAPKKAMDGGYDQLEINPETGEVAPFDKRMMDDATNLASLVSPVSAASRIAPVAGAVGRRAGKAAIPEMDDLVVAKDAAYDFADKLGARYTAEAMDELSGDMIRRAVDGKFNPGLHRDTAAFLDELGQKPQAMSLTQLDQLRQIIREDLVKPNGNDARFGKQFIAAIDDFIERAGPDKIGGVAGETANYAIRTARKANTTLRRAETVQEIIENARLSAAASGSGGNIDNSIRQGFARVLKSDKLSMGFSKDELAQMKRVVVGTKGQNALRLLGKLSPSGNGLMAALGLGATMANPALALAPAAGLAAKTLADRTTQRGVEGLTKMVRNGGGDVQPLPARQGSALTPKASTTLLEQNFGPKLLRLPGKGFVRLDA